MKLCFDATRFRLGLQEAVAFAAGKQIQAIEFAFMPFTTSSKSTKLTAQEKEYLARVNDLAKSGNVQIVCIRLNSLLNPSDKQEVKHFQQIIYKLGAVASAVQCQRIVFTMQPGQDENWIPVACQAIDPVIERLGAVGIRLLLSLSTTPQNHRRSLRWWRPLEPQEWRDLLAGCSGLALSFSAADCIWQNIDYLRILPGIVAAVEHVEANDIEINRDLLVDSGLFGPLWWRYRRAGKGQIDWRQLIEALKLYDYQGYISIHLDDEFIDEMDGNLEESLDESIKFLQPIMK